MAGEDQFTLQRYPLRAPQPACAVALVVHGLNVAPAKMAAITSCLVENGIEAFSLALHGHGANYTPRQGLSEGAARLESLRQVTYRLWYDEVLAAHAVVAQRAAQLGDVPVHLVAYSLGGLVACDVFASAPRVRFARMVLFAPALRIRMMSYLLRPLASRSRFVFPSFSPREYRANPGTALAAYAALYTAAAHLAEHTSDKINVPALVLLDPQDELVSYRGTSRYLHAAGLTNWRLLKVRKDPTARQRYHHLVIDAVAVGDACWRELAAAVAAHLAPAAMRAGDTGPTP
jgi:alpha-beta hydrolase superfamily lysophospholipase